jgi:hypothetical protein
VSRAPLAAILALLLAGCTGGSGPDPEVSTPSPGVPITAPGLAEVVLLAPPTEGAGEVPTFSWEPVDGAVGYRLFVLDAQSEPVWAWQGPETTVALGGLTVERPDGEAGPVITPGSRWSVAALDAEGGVVAVSRLRPVSP